MENLADENVFFIADTHFGDERILKYENRPFESSKQMDNVLVNNWNTAVSDNDIVFHLWDIWEYSLMSELNGKKYLVKWNHETNDNGYYRKLWFIEVYDMPVIFQNFWILSHEPLYVNANIPYANIFAHVHLDPKYKTVSEQSFCVSCDRIGFKPISFAEIKAEIDNQK